MNSIWMDTTVWKNVSYGSLVGDKKTDVLIIGGGFCGILCTYLLKQAGINCILVEKDSLLSGISKNTTAKITSQHGLIYDQLIRQFGIEKARLYRKANEEALQIYQQLSEFIPCDFETKDSYLYSLTNDRNIKKEVEALNILGFPAEFTAQTELPFSIKGAVRMKNQGQFHPIKFIRYILENLEIYEHTKITAISNNTAWHQQGKIRAKKIIVATHFPLINTHGSYFLKMYQHRSYVLALSNAGQVNGMYVDEAKEGLSFRNYENLLLLGGGSHRTGKSGGAYKELRCFAQKYYPQSSIQCYFATQDCMSLDGVPYIGQYSKRTKDLYVATGFNKWGMTSSMVAAKLLCDLVQEKENEYEEVFSPSRTIVLPQLLINGLEATKNLLTPRKKRCPHLGCALKWNKEEHTYDCPCHGSRFESDGTLIDNPATKDARWKQGKCVK